MTQWERREVSEITKRSTASIVAPFSLHLAMTLVHVCFVLGVALLAAPTPLKAAPSQPAQAAANLLSVWPPEHRETVASVSQGKYSRRVSGECLVTVLGADNSSTYPASSSVII